jgi:hypothetical protein
MFRSLLERFLSLSVPVRVLLLLAALGVGVGWTAWLLGRGGHPWLEVLKDEEGKIAGLRVDPRKIPGEVLDRIPKAGDDTPLRDPAQIAALAEQYGLFHSREANPHLTFDDGDIRYWSEQKRPAWELEMEFFSRRLVLDAAEGAGARIPSPGDLTKAASTN